MLQPTLMKGEASMVEIPTIGETADGPRLSKATGLYYTKPSGAMYRDYFSETGQITQSTYVYIPYFKYFTFENKSDDPTTTKWFFNGYDDTENADSNGDYTEQLSVGYIGYVPVLKNSTETDEYTMGYYGTNVSHSLVGSGIVESDGGYYGWMGFTDNKYVYGWGDMFDNNDYIMGSGSYTGTRQGYDASGNLITEEGTFIGETIYQTFPAPISPLYVDCVYLDGLIQASEDNPEPLPNGVELTMEITDHETGEEVITLTATTGCYTQWNYYPTSSYGPYSTGYLKFSKTEYDPLFGYIEASFILDRAVDLKITGWDQEGVNFGTRGPLIQDCDGESLLSTAKMAYKPTGNIVTSSRYQYTKAALGVQFKAIMDNLMVAEDLYWSNSSGETTAHFDQCNVIRISEDGKTCTNEYIDENHNLGGAYVLTTCAWYENGLEYYSLELPDWIASFKVDEYGSGMNTYLMSFTADPIESGGRIATVYIKGRGITCDTPIIILQGDATYDGIESISSVSAVQTAKGAYNLAGQRVGESAKGIIIENGKKIIK